MKGMIFVGCGWVRERKRREASSSYGVLVRMKMGWSMVRPRRSRPPRRSTQEGESERDDKAKSDVSGKITRRRSQMIK